MMPWLLALRPKTLSAAVVPVLVGTAVVVAQATDWRPWISWCALACALLIQIATNFFNDAIDFKKGADREGRLGPKRVTQSGLLSAQAVTVAGVVAGLGALAFGVPLVLEGGWPIVAIGLVSLILSYAYTGGPYPLAYRGLGDLFVFIFFGLVAVGGVVYLHLGEWGVDAIVAGMQVGLLGTVLIAINNFRDHQQDRAVGKMTLAARFGAEFARNEITILLIFVYLLGFWWALTARWAAALLPILSLPLAWFIWRGTRLNEPSPLLNRYLVLSGALQLLFGGLLAWGLIL
jgi:1,4-dihydroxy-2-naphthoate polyprenyltransferase